jgi:hypothetical protein
MKDGTQRLRALAYYANADSVGKGGATGEA